MVAPTIKGWTRSRAGHTRPQNLPSNGVKETVVSLSCLLLAHVMFLEKLFKYLMFLLDIPRIHHVLICTSNLTWNYVPDQ